MSSKSSGSHYEVLERLGKYQPKTYFFNKAGINYQCDCFDDTANVIGNSVVVEKDFEKTSTIVFRVLDKKVKSPTP